MKSLRKYLGTSLLLPAVLLMTGCPQKTASAPTPPPPSQTADNQPINVPAGKMMGLLREAHGPIYPAEAIKEGIEGTVYLKCTISKTGTVEHLRLISSSNPLLTDAAFRAVYAWKYHPYYWMGRPMRVDTRIKVVFLLPKKKAGKAR